MSSRQMRSFRYLRRTCGVWLLSMFSLLFAFPVYQKKKIYLFICTSSVLVMNGSSGWIWSMNCVCAYVQDIHPFVWYCIYNYVKWCSAVDPFWEKWLGVCSLWQKHMKLPATRVTGACYLCYWVIWKIELVSWIHETHRCLCSYLVCGSCFFLFCS